MKPLLVVMALLAVPAIADNDFDSLVRSMENHYGTKKMYIPFMGVANFFVKVAKPAGTKDFKLAVFEHVDRSQHPSAEELDRRFLSRGWKPFVRVTSNNKRRERVQIYARASGRDQDLLVTTFEDDEAVMVRVRVNPEGLSKWVNNPRFMCRRVARTD